MYISIGSYGGSIAGWSNKSESDALALRFAFKAHDSSVKMLAIDKAAANLLVSGGGDETVKYVTLAVDC